MFKQQQLSGLWSAAPTPLNKDYSLDEESVSRLAEHHAKLGVRGVFIGGTSGEGPWITRGMMRKLAQLTAGACSGKMLTAAQVTDNSAMRIIDNIMELADTGIDIAVIAPPYFLMRADQQYLLKMYSEVIEKSPLPIGLYHRGKHSSVEVAPETFAELAAHPSVIMIKDSSDCTHSRDVFLRLKAETTRENLVLLNGNEFDCVSRIAEGYDGLLLGGACFTGKMAGEIMSLSRQQRLEEARAMQDRMNQLMYEVFGGRDIRCWLAGQKRMMVELGVFSTPATIINFSLDAECEQAIRRVCEQEREWLCV